MPANDTDFIFPSRVIPYMRDLRSNEWRNLVDRVDSVSTDNPDCLAFVLMIVRLTGCVTCQADSYKAMRGCTLCATQTIRRYKGNDIELLNNYESAKQDVGLYLDKLNYNQYKNNIQMR